MLVFVLKAFALPNDVISGIDGRFQGELCFVSDDSIGPFVVEKLLGKAKPLLHMGRSQFGRSLRAMRM